MIYSLIINIFINFKLKINSKLPFKGQSNFTEEFRHPNMSVSTYLTIIIIILCILLKKNLIITKQFLKIKIV